MSMPQVLNAAYVRIATLLAAGLKSQQVSSIVNLSPSRIAQIAALEDFQVLLKEKLAEAEKKDVEETAITAKYLSAEHLLVDQIMSMAPSAELRDVTAALRVVAERQDKAKTRINPIHAGVTVHQHVVQLNLPAHALPEIRISSSNEVTSIDQTNLAPLTSDGVQNLFKSMKENRNDQGRTLEGTSSVIAEAQSQSSKSQPQPQLAFAF